MFADDLIMISTSQAGLQDSLGGLQEYCEKWKLNINYKKSKVMVFSKGTQKEKKEFFINDKKLEVVREYKYLGISINCKNCSFTPSLADLHCKGTRAMYALFSLLPMKLLSIKILLKIFDACITPIILYGSEVWAPYLNHDYSKWNSNLIERLHSQFKKRIIGVNRSTTNGLVRAETGRFPLLSQALSRNLKYLQDLQQKDNSVLAKQAYLYESTCDNDRGIMNLLKTYGNNLRTFLNEDPLIVPKHKLRSSIFSLFNDLWRDEIRSFTKADLYVQHKSNVKFETYLSTIKNRKQRVAFTKYRLSDHTLQIENGRRKNPKIPRELRICPICRVEVENEIHFLLKCEAYLDREEFLNWITTSHVPNFKHLNLHDKFIYLMSQDNDIITAELAKKIFLWFKKRDELTVNGT